MRSNEFRLGNLYHFEDVSGMVVERVDYIENNMVDVNPMDLIHPIPLTEEWLLKFGFEKSTFGSSTMFFSNNDSFGYIEEQAYRCNDNYGYCLNDEKMWFLEIKYVHQLQNLFFALTGEELTIQES